MSGEIESSIIDRTELPAGELSITSEELIPKAALDIALNTAKLEKEQAVKNAWKDATTSVRADETQAVRYLKELLYEIEELNNATTKASEVYGEGLLFIGLTDTQRESIRTQIRILTGIEDSVRLKLDKLHVDY